MSTAMQSPRPTADPYLPDHGDPGFGVEHYELDLAYKPAANFLTGRARLTIQTLQPTRRLTLDLYGLRVTKLTVTGAMAQRWRHSGSRIAVRLAAEVTAGTRLTVEIHYRGEPRPMPGPDGRAGWEELADGVIVASQPHGSPTWFPCNDRADDKARFDIEINAPIDYQVTANGALVSRSDRGRSRSWHYRMAEPMSPYLATVQIGRYGVYPIPSAPGSPVCTTLVCPPQLHSAALDAFADQCAMISFFEGLFGPYPFSAGYVVVVTADDLEIPLESQGLSTFGANLVHREWGAQRLIAHELSHQWFGNSVTARSLSQIWLHEGFACYCEWLWSQESGGRGTDEWARQHWGAVAAQPADLVIGAPGADRMFDDRVYKRGALTLHALRLRLGDQMFFTILRTWLDRYRHTVASTAEFQQLCEEVSGEQLGHFFQQWLMSTRLPPLQSARGI